MNEAVFPILGAAFVFVVALPVSALLARAALLVLESVEARGPLHGLNLRYLILTGSSILPVGWLLSAGLHQVEAGRSVVGCLLNHEAASRCFEPGYFSAALAMGVVFFSARSIRERRWARSSTSPRALDALRRVEALASQSPQLRDLVGRTRVTESDGFALGTEGLFHRGVVIGVEYADALADDALVAALAHECEHVRSFDPLRYGALQLALAINPIGAVLLAQPAARWVGAREAHCDREAVIRGASPLALADAIVRAARPTHRFAVALGTDDTALLRFRVNLLFAFAEAPPTHCCHRGSTVLPVAVALLVATLLLPHGTSTAALDALHSGTEQALAYFPY